MGSVASARPIPFVTDGYMGGVNGDGDIPETDNGEPGIRPIAAAAISMAEVESGGRERRSSSVVWAKRQTRREQLESSLQRRVRYCTGWSQHSKTPWAYSQRSPRRHAPFCKSGQWTLL